MQLSRLSGFLSLLSLGDRRTDLHRLFQALVDTGRDLQTSLRDQAVQALRAPPDDTKGENNNVNRVHRMLLDCTNMASFYTDAGWYDSAAQIYTLIVERADALLAGGVGDDDGDDNADEFNLAQGALMAVKAEASVKLLGNLSSFCKFTAAAVRSLWPLKVKYMSSNCPSVSPSFRKSPDIVQHHGLLGVRRPATFAADACHTNVRTV